MIKFHLKEIFYRTYYFFISFALIFIILTFNKYKILYALAPVNLIYNNTIDIFIVLFLLTIVLSFLICIPYLIYSVLKFLNKGFTFQESYITKKWLKFYYFNFLLWNTISFFIILNFIIFMSTYNKLENISIIMSINSLISLIINYYLIFNVGLIILCFLQIKKFNKSIIYIIIFFISNIILNLDFLYVLLLNITYVLFTELLYYMYYIYFNKGFVT